MNEHVCFYGSTCVHAGVCLHWKRPRSCLICLESSSISKIFRDHFQQPRTMNAPSPSSLPPFLLAESPSVGRCTRRWQPKCQPALHMPASAVPAYSCHSPVGLSSLALPKSVPAPHHPSSPNSSVSILSLFSLTHTHTNTHTLDLISPVPVVPLV